jgi:hypothetical protein
LKRIVVGVADVAAKKHQAKPSDAEDDVDVAAEHSTKSDLESDLGAFEAAAHQVQKLLSGLGDPVADAIDRLTVLEVLDGLRRMGRKDAEVFLRRAEVKIARTPTIGSAQILINKARHGGGHRREYIVRTLTAGVRAAMRAADVNVEDPTSLHDVVCEWPASLVRLGGARDISGDHLPDVVRAAEVLVGEGLAPEEWSAHREPILAACATARSFLKRISDTGEIGDEELEPAETSPFGETATNTELPMAVRVDTSTPAPDEALLSDGALAFDDEAAESILPTQGGGARGAQTPFELFARSKAAMADAREAVARVRSAFDGGGIPTADDLAQFTVAREAMLTVAAATRTALQTRGLELEVDASEESIAAGLAELNRLSNPGRAAVVRMRGVAGDREVERIVSDLRSVTASLLASDSWDDAQTAQVRGLQALTALIDVRSENGAFDARTAAAGAARRALANASLDPTAVDAAQEGLLHFDETGHPDENPTETTATPATPDTVEPPAPVDSDGEAVPAATADVGAAQTGDEERPGRAAGTHGDRETMEPDVTAPPRTDGDYTMVAGSTGRGSDDAEPRHGSVPSSAAVAPPGGVLAPSAGRSDLGMLLRNGKLGGAYWWARANGETEQVQIALRLAAVIDAASGDSDGLAAREVRRILDSVPPEYVLGDHELRLLAVPTITLGCLLAPFSGITGVAASIVDLIADLGPIDKLLRSATEYALRGGPLTLFNGGTDRTNAVPEMEKSASRARAFLAKERVMSFKPKARLWQHLTDAGGLVDGLLGPAAQERLDAVDSVRRLVAELAKGRSTLDGRVREIEHRLRVQHGYRSLDGSNRNQVTNLVAEAVELAAEWVRAVAEVTAAQAADGDRGQQVLLREVRSTFSSNLTAALNTLARHGGAPTAQGAASAGERCLMSVNAILNGRRARGNDLDPNVVLARDILAAPVHLTVELAPRDLAQLRIEDLSGDPSWEQSMDVRLQQHDHLGSNAVLLLCEADGGANLAVLRQQRGDALRRDRESVRGRADALARDIDRAHGRDLITEASLADLHARLKDARSEEREDLGEVFTELNRIDADLVSSREKALQGLVQRLESAVAADESGRTAADQARVMQVIGDEDLVAAEEMILIVESGEQLPTTELPREGVSDFFPRVVDMLPAGINDVVIDAAERGEVLGSLDFSSLDQPARNLAVSAFREWRALREQSAWAMRSINRVLGLEIVGKRDPSKAANRAWIDASSMAWIGKALVPHFGSRIARNSRILLCWNDPSESALMQWTSEAGTADRGVIVFHFGTMSADRRLALGAASRANLSLGPPLIVVDDAVLAFSAAFGRARYETVIRATLPFTALNPYVVQGAIGDIDEEIFYGRREEMHQLQERNRQCLVYGGGQLGKSSLLRAAQRAFERPRDGVARGAWRSVYIDLLGKGLGKGLNDTPPDGRLIWGIIGHELSAQGLAQDVGPSAGGVATAIHGWLAGGDGRRLLLLLDECDAFFEADAPHFTNTQRLKELMEATNIGFKPVFAGLHSVQRFSDVPNQPFAHLATPILIGPLRPQHAFNLLSEPLGGLGYDFASDDLIHGILAMTANHPALLQLVGHALTAELQTHRPSPNVPCMITDQLVRRIKNDQNLQRSITKKFDRTLKLDKRYKVIANAIALAIIESGRDEALTVQGLRAVCREYWPAAFGALSIDAFRALLDEMVGLGVLSTTAAGRYRLRSSTILNLLGETSQVVEELKDISETNPTPEATKIDYRPLLNGGTGLSPLTERQLAEIFRPGSNRTIVIVASIGLNREDIIPAINAAGTQLLVDVYKPDRRSSYEMRLDTMEPGRHCVVVSSLCDVKEDNARQSIDDALRRLPCSGSSRTVALVVPSDYTRLLLDVISGAGIYEQAGIIAVNRFSEDDVHILAEDLSAVEVSALVRATGGWPAQVDRAMGSLRDGRAVADVIEELNRDLEDPAACDTFIADVGLDGVMGSAWETIVDALDGGMPTQPEDLLEFLRDDMPHADGLVTLLREMQVLLHESDGSVVPEPFLLRAWRSRSTAPASEE